MREISGEVERLGAPSSRRLAAEQLGDELVGATPIGLGDVGAGERQRSPMDGIDLVGRRQAHGLLTELDGGGQRASSCRRVACLLERGSDLGGLVVGGRRRRWPARAAGSSTRPASSR